MDDIYQRRCISLRIEYPKTNETMAVALSTVLSVLAVVAHPDDEVLFGGLIHALTHHLNVSVDLVCVTNGEGGFAYAGLSQPLYANQKLSEESIGRTYLPHILQ